MTTTPFTAIAIIPARLGSTRLSRKVLREIAGKPMVGHVYESAKKSPLLQEVIIATDSDEVMQVARTRGWNVQMT
ncbi:MAG TPA: 3-deoxy-manno-octulosonate cytidylyltransferase, partial [Candidatus Sulfotelmatobacter sp.]|nr:3-deoxy-manno-octulosonate cytidylyltransferase [Candidatus Sulfotelmatobacter sp.]